MSKRESIDPLTLSLIETRLHYINQEVGERMLAHDIEPFTCVPANLIVLAIEEKLDRPVELAEIRVEDGIWDLLLVIFESRPTLD